MRIRFLKPAITSFGIIYAGEVRDIPTKIAQAWIKDGIAMQDKSIEPKEKKG